MRGRGSTPDEHLLRREGSGLRGHGRCLGRALRDNLAYEVEPHLTDLLLDHPRNAARRTGVDVGAHVGGKLLQDLVRCEPAGESR